MFTVKFCVKNKVAKETSKEFNGNNLMAVGSAIINFMSKYCYKI